ncbi:MAG: lactate racemase domain-containing protein [Bacteroidota bacterium]
MIGKGSPQNLLTETEVHDLVSEFVERERLSGKRVLAIIPDNTRSAPIGLFFRVLYGLVARQPGGLDFLIALGTHPPMTEGAIDLRLGLSPGERATRYPNARVFNHHWRDPDQLRLVGTIPAERVAEMSHGMMDDPVPVSINRLVFDYDVLLIIGPTFPHEVVGFSGGNKCLFPGISGQEIIDMFHWLGALITSPAIIGKKQTAVRSVVDAAAAMVTVPRLCMSLVVREEGLAGLFCGPPEEAWSAAADLSEKVHIHHTSRAFRRILSCAPPMYDDLWVGAKAAYKLEPVVADGGELIVYAPHIREISVTHGALIRSVGYHVRDYFLKQKDRFTHIPGGVLAHATHLKGVGTFTDSREHPRINVILATGITEKTCREVNLGYQNPEDIDPEHWMNREEEGILYVPKAGEILYRQKNDPFAS